MDLGDEAIDLSLERLEGEKWKYAHVHFGGGLFEAGGDLALGFTIR